MFQMLNGCIFRFVVNYHPSRLRHICIFKSFLSEMEQVNAVDVIFANSAQLTNLARVVTS